MSPFQKVPRHQLDAALTVLFDRGFGVCNGFHCTLPPKDDDGTLCRCELLVSIVATILRNEEDLQT